MSVDEYLVSVAYEENSLKSLDLRYGWVTTIVLLHASLFKVTAASEIVTRSIYLETST